jgi:hypothetical protein
MNSLWETNGDTTWNGETLYIFIYIWGNTVWSLAFREESLFDPRRAR